MSTKAQEARKQAEAVLKFFGIKPTGNVMKDLGELADADLDNLEKNVCKLIFDSYDEGGNGNVNVVDFKHMVKDVGEMTEDEDMKNITDEQAAEFIKEIDTDGNGTIEFNEFFEWFNKP
jgi:hypothetical protein